MIAFAIKCGCESCSDLIHSGESPAAWICRAERPEKPYVSFPLLGVFSFGKEEDRLVFSSKEIADALIDIFHKEGKEQNLESVEVQWDSNHVIGRLPSK